MEHLRKLSIQYFGGFVEKRQMEFLLPPSQPTNDQAGRGASGEIMAVNKTLGIIYRLSGGRWGSLVKLNILPPERIKH